MLVRPEPLPDELDRGYLGRVGRINGIQNERHCVSMITSWAGLAGRSRKKVPCVELLRRISEMTTKAFVCRHTMLPFRRGITSCQPDMPHGDASSRTMLRASGLRLARPGSYFCCECVAADQDFHGISYWRREHQIPGTLRCDKHSTPLCYVDDERSFYAAPSAFLGNCRSISAERAQRSSENPAVRRYLEICSGLLDRPIPFDVQVVSRALTGRACRSGLQRASSPRRTAATPLLSDVVLDAFGTDWIAQVFPDLVEKPRGEVMNRMDGVLYQGKSAFSVVPYVLAASVLFGSSDDALDSFLDYEEIEKRRRAERASRRV
ncbi:TniQ family protein [Aromatoleum toluclasticum]|uniref:TniQ family protein n=1 Tax=Aromatoleum toluclasticum TaxID=92003 RepID=UPI001D18C265|nr:TniQ family protein [Aromatoleum toluclasticum]MCC4118621.1 TniQ family protein [Aromatoleum toluclasticum]